MLKDLFLSPAVLFELQQRLCNNYTAIRDHFRDYLDVHDRDILDVGCSTGTCASVAVRMDQNRYIGIDVAPQYVRLAARRHPAGKFLTMDARQLSFADNSFDVVMFIGVLHHMDDQLIKDCLKDIRRVLRRDGVVLCAEPVFTPGKLLSTVLLTCDRGRHIRNEAGYRGLFDGFAIASQRYFSFSIHRFCSFVLKKPALALVA
jgi:ubiquinone/menaquinone biosynthesis C-methylase UbiE